MKIEKTAFGTTSDGKEVFLYTCRNANGLVMKVMTYGAIVVALETPDRDGKLANVTMGFESLDGKTVVLGEAERVEYIDNE